MKKIVSVILSLLLFSATAFAQSTASYSAAGGGSLHITLSNNASQAKEVVIRLSKEKRENYTNDTTFYIFKQIRLQANTEESLTLAMPRNLPAGAYYLDISSADDVLTIYHNNKENLEGKLSLIEGAKTIADMENAMETITQNIAIDFDVYEQYKPKIIKWMLAFKSSKLNFDSFFDLYYSAEAMAQIEGSSIENTLSILKEYSQTANFDISKLLAADKNVQDGVCRWLADPPTVLSSIDEYISEYLALKTLYFAPTWQKLETLITKDLKEELGIDTGVYDTLENKELVIQAMYKVEYTTIAKVREDFNKKVSEQKASESKSSGKKTPSGGGGGGGGKYGSVSIETPVISQLGDSDNNGQPSKEIFSDVNANHWAYNAIGALYEKKIVLGSGDGTFNPEGSVTRAEFVKMIVGAFFGDYQSKENAFADVSDSDWYCPYVNAGYELGVISGVGDNNFAPNAGIKREDMSLIALRTLEKLNVSPVQVREYSNFSDEDLISDYAVDSVKALYKSGIISGTDSSKFSPQEYVTRAQAAKIIYELLNLSGGIS